MLGSMQQVIRPALLFLFLQLMEAMYYATVAYWPALRGLFSSLAFSIAGRYHVGAARRTCDDSCMEIQR
jgi:hypothetical protein